MWPFECALSAPYALIYKERCSRSSFVSDPLKMAVSPDGKYIFLIGARKIRVTAEGQHPEWTTSFEMNVINVDLESRRTVRINDLCDFGEYFVQLYAIDSRTLVILDYNFAQLTLRQRLIKVYAHSTYSPFHRCYRYITSQTSYIKTAIGCHYCAVVSRARFEGDFIALMLPKSPADFSSTLPLPMDIGANITEMNDGLSLSLSLSVTHYISPFFMRNDQDLCFLAINNSTLDIDAKTIVCLNISRRIWYTRGVSRNAKSNFPQDEYEQTPLIVDCSVSGCGFRQLALVARYRTPLYNWRWRVCDAILWIQMRLIRLFFLCLDYRAEFIGKIILSLTSAVSWWRDYLILRPFTRVGVLNLESLLWTDVSNSLSDVRFTDQITQFASNTGQIVSFVCRMWSDDDCEVSIRMLKSPFVIPSLYSLANFQLRKSTDSSVLEFRRKYVRHLSSIGDNS
uniref:C2 domain-containing protein n=2 Tax=Parascaris univalens TaxID=6257 RepID=A0A915A5L7_PARUN